MQTRVTLLRLSSIAALVFTAVAPAVSTAEPTTQRSSARSLVESQSRVKVMIAPFRPIAPSATSAWVATAIRESVRGDLARARNLEIVDTPPSLVPLASDAAAVSAALRAEARFVVSGTYQIVDNNIRIVSQLSDVTTGDVVGSYKQTGDIGSLFELQDELASDVRYSLAKVLVPQGTTPTSDTPMVATNTGPLRLDISMQPLANPYLQPYEDQHSTMSRQNYFYNSGPGSTTYFRGYGYRAFTYGRTHHRSFGAYRGGRASAYPYFAAAGGAASRYGAATP